MGRKLLVTVRGAKINNKATPYCVCTLLDSHGGFLTQYVQKTRVIQSSCCNPVWEQLLEFDVNTDFHGFKLECFDKRKLRADKIIGSLTVKVNPDMLSEQEIIDEWFPLKHKQQQRGELQLRVKCSGNEERVVPTRTNSNITSTPPTITTTASSPTPSHSSSSTTTTSTTSSTNLNGNNNPNRNSTQMDADSTAATINSSSSNSISSNSTSTSISNSTHSSNSLNSNIVTLAPLTSANSADLTKSPSWEHPTTSQNLLKRSYVIIEEDANGEEGEEDENENENENESESSNSVSSVSSPSVSASVTPSSSRAKLTTSFKPTSDEEYDEDEEADEVMEEADEYEEYEDNDKDYDNWDTIDEDEEQTIKPKSLSTSGIFQAREAKISKVRDILGVPSHIAQALLQYFQWDEEKFLMRFLENPAAIYKEARLEAPKENKDGANSVGEIMCSVCFEDDQDDITALNCNHYFCNDCWKTHIEVALKEGRSLDITCMHHKCKELMPEYIVRKVVDLETFKKYSAFLSKGFVEGNANMKWCPKPGCTNAVDASQVIREGKCQVAKCECGYKFCFLCSEDSHTPATCSMMKEWAKKCADDSETYNWIAANTKDCPQKNCGVPIEKNDGCFMMTCQKCRYQFCWLCCESWASHNDHFRCNKYNEAKLDNKPSWMDGRSNTDARQALDRYLFYYNRYINHLSSLKFEDVSREKARAMMEKLQKSGTHSYIDVQFIEAALNQLLDNRRTLKNTYVYAFYQQDPLKKDLFEFSQADLEKITEKIAQLLKENEETLISSSATIKSMTQVASRSLSNLLYDENL